MATIGPAFEVQRRIVELFRASADLQPLLFPAWNSAPVHELDMRVYMSNEQFPQSGPASKVASQLPRVIVSAQSEAHEWEQTDPDKLSSPIMIQIHSLTPRPFREDCERLDAAVVTTLLSTLLTNERIIASDLTPVGSRIVLPEKEFNDAWRITSQFRAASVGVLL